MFSNPLRRKSKEPAVLDFSNRAEAMLGRTYKEKISGMEGVCVFISYEIDGTILVGIRTKGTKPDGTPKDTHEFDVELLTLVENEDQVTLNDKASAEIAEVKIGAIYTDSVTGLEGTAARLMLFLGGCARVTLRPKVDKDGKKVEGMNVPIEQLVLKDAAPAAEAEKNKKPTGGPDSTMSGIMADKV